VGSDYELKVKEGAQQYLEPGEQVRAAVWAKARGSTQAIAGGLANMAVGSRSVKKSKDAGEQAGFAIPSPVALAITDKRLLAFDMDLKSLGKPGDLKGLANEAPLAEVDSIDVKRLLLGKTMKLSVRGTEIKLELVGSEDAKGLAEEFERAKAAA
jgi:hypothetical protein